MKLSTILAVFGLAGAGAAQVTTIPTAISTTGVVTTITPTVIPRPSSSVSSRSRSSRSSVSSRRSRTSTSSVPGPSVITTVVSQFVTVCAVPTTFYVNSVCYTATSSNQPITVTNCPCTVASTLTAPYVAPTGAAAVSPITAVLVTSPAPAPAVTSVAAVGSTPAPTYVTAGGSRPTLMLGLMAFLMSLPLLAALVL